jgi:hypothetical protein
MMELAVRILDYAIGECKVLAHIVEGVLKTGQAV